ncbi:hypothetical protein FA95DRAFT_370194 [Auriscalpium vulgare]|uniref:Uncharacterized protein n=1 Tax=Auriscalpium vulgare TaxID=40419 RepID=A0ACB8RHU6_9AGAM|nr:hypothetical protein FA95DRAFT_370194 [Auriscalpium vulgare]
MHRTVNPVFHSGCSARSPSLYPSVPLVLRTRTPCQIARFSVPARKSACAPALTLKQDVLRTTHSTPAPSPRSAELSEDFLHGISTSDATEARRKMTVPLEMCVSPCDAWVAASRWTKAPLRPATSRSAMRLFRDTRRVLE